MNSANPDAVDSTVSELSAGHLIVAQLEREGVERVYSVPGESFLDVLDGLHDSTIRTVTARHEGGAGFMALTEGRLTDTPGIAMVTRGPGAANAFISVHTAWQDATAMVLFVGLIPVADRGREAFQEFDVQGWFGATTKYVTTLDDPSSAARVVAEAMLIARSGRPGPVVIGLPEDVIRRPTDGATTIDPSTPTIPAMDQQAAEELTRRFNQAQRPLIVVGGDRWSGGTGAALAQWALEHHVPVASDFRAYDAVPHSAGSWIGSLGYGRANSTATALQEADLVVFIGAERTDVLSDGYTIGFDAETVLVLPHETKGHSGRVDYLIPTTPEGFVAGLTWCTPDAASRQRLTALRESYLHYRTPVHYATPSTVKPEPASEATPSGDDTPDYADLDVVIQVLGEEMAPDAVVTYGAGNHALWAARYLPHESARSLAAPRNGAMGMGIPAAVAASLIFPGREVISVAGDGCFQMNGQEFATAVAYGGQFIAVVVDNGIYATIREHQEQHYPGRPSGTDMVNPDFAAIARASGGHGETVHHASQFRDAFRRARASGVPAIIHIHQDPTVRAPSQPPASRQPPDAAPG